MASIYKEYLESLKEQFSMIHKGNEVSIRMKLMGFLCDINSAINLFEEAEKKSECMPQLDIDIDVDYKKWSNPEFWGDTHTKSEVLGKAYKSKQEQYDEARRVVDYLIQNKAEDENDAIKIEERNNKFSKTRLLIDTIASDELFDDYHLNEAFKSAFSQLLKVLSRIDCNLSKSWSKKEYEDFFLGLLKPSNKKFLAFDPVRQDFNKWKEDGFGDIEAYEYEAKIGYETKKLLRTDFIQPNVQHTPSDFKKKIEALKRLIDIDTLSDLEQQRCYSLVRLVGFDNGRFKFDDYSSLGKYIYKYRRNISAEDLESFLFFVRMVKLVYQDMDKKNVDSGTENEKYKYIVDINAKEKTYEFIKSQIEGKKGKNLALYVECAVDAGLLSDMDFPTLVKYYSIKGSDSGFNNYFQKDKFTDDEKKDVTELFKNAKL